ncbi:hypothetical protein ACDA63_16310 [Uliginosibacterium sp. sgz301328]|uniref:hypothetical protein n=1 Tax=Uliginosibacterium sp. sgz301328 TaxID=3243764 RepID=UPI00359EA55C
MSKDTQRDFLERYEDMEDHQILALHRRREDLIGEARSALDVTMDRRGLDRSAPATESAEEVAQGLRDGAMARLCSLGLAAIVCVPLAWAFTRFVPAVGPIAIAFIVVAAAVLGHRIGLQIVRRISEHSELPIALRAQSLQRMLAGEVVIGVALAVAVYAMRVG